jgi:hypothetical protein
MEVSVMARTPFGCAPLAAALLIVGLVSPVTATAGAQEPATPAAASAPTAPTLTSDDMSPGYDEVFLSLADVPLGPITGQMVLESFVRREQGPGPALILSIGVRAPEFTALPSVPSAQRQMLDGGATSFLQAGDDFAGMRDSFLAGSPQRAETVRTDREAVQPPALAPGAWMVMDQYRYQRGAQEGRGAIAVLGRDDMIGILVVESPDGRANDALVQYARIMDARMLQATEGSQ